MFYAVVLQAGLYNKWLKDEMDQSRLNGIAKRRKQKQEEKGQNVDEQLYDKKNKALTIVHMQGPLVLILLGLLLAGVVFTIEILTKHIIH